MAIKSKKNVKKHLNRSFLSKDFDSFRSELLQHARIFYPDKINDFSEPSVGGLLLDMAAMVGDSLSFYLDHSFRELDPLRAVELESLETHLENAGINEFSASPSSVMLTLIIEAPAELINGDYLPKNSALPVLLEGTQFQSTAGVSFFTTQDVNFSKKDKNGFFICDYEAILFDSDGNPSVFQLSKEVIAVSGNETTESFTFGDHVPFREIVLNNTDVTQVLSVVDSSDNVYREVEALSQDNVFISVENHNRDSDLVSSNLELIPAPRRFVTQNSISSGQTTLQFGSGDAEIFDDDILPDPSEVSLELFGKTSFSRFSIDPNSLLKTRTLGISPSNTTLSVRYRFGGGTAHNVGANSINSLVDLQIEFRNRPSVDDALSVRESVQANNSLSAKGGAGRPSITQLRQQIITARNSQMRIVTDQDLLARIYTLPSRFGRVFRASIEKNPSNPLAKLLYVCSVNSEGFIDVAPDALKLNLSTYLNEYRLISDAVDILDVRVTNFAISYEIVVSRDFRASTVIASVNLEVASFFDRSKMQIGEPIITDDIVNLIINTSGVVSLVSLQIRPRTGSFEGRLYSDSTFPFEENTKYGVMYGPIGSIFELRYPALDVNGTAV